VANNYSTHKEMADLIGKVEKQGWRIVRGKGHVKCFAPNGKDIVVTATSPGGGRGVANFRATLRRAGGNV
jgi:hypothetical protein